MALPEQPQRFPLCLLSPVSSPLTEGEAISQTRRWVESVVIGLGLCPFAAKSVYEDRVRCRALPDLHRVDRSSAHISTAEPMIRLIELILEEADRLVHTEVALTSLIITPLYLLDFEEFLDASALIEEVLAEHEYEGTLQLATFHPRYRFQDEEALTGYTNRAPHPTFHLILEREITQVSLTFPDLDEIPILNKEMMERMGVIAIESLLKSCGWRPQ